MNVPLLFANGSSNWNSYLQKANHHKYEGLLKVIETCSKLLPIQDRMRICLYFSAKLFSLSTDE